LSTIEPVLASWSVGLYFDCPYCNAFNDACEYPEFWIDNRKLNIGDSDREIEVVCDSCNKEVTIKTVW
jgi:hypothetical protein